MDESQHKIRVDVDTSYLAEQSDPKERRFVFSYTITIRNEGNVPARLLTRHWIITDSNGKVQEVRGEGVVGIEGIVAAGVDPGVRPETLSPAEFARIAAQVPEAP